MTQTPKTNIVNFPDIPLRASPSKQLLALPPSSYYCLTLFSFKQIPIVVGDVKDISTPIFQPEVP